MGMSSKVTELTKQSEELAKILALFRNGVCIQAYTYTLIHVTHIVYTYYIVSYMYII